MAGCVRGLLGSSSALEADPREREPERRVGLLEHSARRRRRVAQAFPHADELGSLTRKEKGEHQKVLGGRW
jgi:hypothetical protein